jgi:hypothetical protein
MERGKYWKEPNNPMAVALEAGPDDMVLVVSFRINSPKGNFGCYGLKLGDASGHTYQSTVVGGSVVSVDAKKDQPSEHTSSVGFKIPSNADIRSFSIGDTVFDIQEQFQRSGSR